MQRAASRERKGTFRQARLEAFVFGDTTKGADREHAVGWEIEIKSTDTEQHHVFPPCLVFEFFFHSLFPLSPPTLSLLFSAPLPLCRGGERNERKRRERGERKGKRVKQGRQGREGKERQECE